MEATAPVPSVPALIARCIELHHAGDARALHETLITTAHTAGDDVTHWNAIVEAFSRERLADPLIDALRDEAASHERADDWTVLGRALRAFGHIAESVGAFEQA